MRFSTDDDELSITFELDDGDPPGLDLTADGLGDELLQLGLDEMFLGFGNEQSPGGDAWAELASSTVAQKHHSLIGVRSGQMLEDLHSGRFAVAPRSATWSFPRGATWARAEAFHNGRPGQPARQFIGWSDEAKDQCRRLVTDNQPQPEE